MTNLDELERMEKKYAELKKSRNDADKGQLAGSVVDLISLPSFSFPLKEVALSSDGTTRYVYENYAIFPELYDFLVELFHSKVPLEVRGAKFGPGEIIVSKQSEEEADVELGLCVKELQELVHTKKSEIFSKYAGAP